MLMGFRINPIKQTYVQKTLLKTKLPAEKKGRKPGRKRVVA
jgi:hypothetical protein